MTDELARVRQAADGPVQPSEDAPKGGQFALGGGRVGAKGKRPPAHRPAAHAPAKPAPPKPLGFDGKSGTGYGVKGGDARVRSLQSALNRLGLTDDSGKPLAVDGKFGPKTTAAVRKLQKEMGVEVTGKVTDEFVKQASAMRSPPKAAAKKRTTPRKAPAAAKPRPASVGERVSQAPMRRAMAESGMDMSMQKPRRTRHVFDNGTCTTCGY